MKTKLLILLMFFITHLCKTQQITNLNVSQLNIDGVNQIEFTWQTINEYKWCYFVIERDTNNNNNYAAYDTMNALGSTTQASNYLYTDFGPLRNGVIYSYRLKLIVENIPPAYCDLFGFYSDTASVTYNTSSIDEHTAIPFSIFPNPNNGTILIKNSNTINSIQIYNVIGKIIYNSINPLYSGMFTIDISDKPKGIYFISIKSENNFYNHKLLKQ